MTLKELKVAIADCEYQGAVDETVIQIWDDATLCKFKDGIEIVFLGDRIEIAGRFAD